MTAGMPKSDMIVASVSAADIIAAVGGLIYYILRPVLSFLPVKIKV